MNKFRLIIILLLTIVLLLTFFISIDYVGLWHAMSGARIIWIFLSLSVGLGAFYVRVKRWHYLLLPMKSIAGMPLFKAIMIGFSVTIVLPGRVGELVRPYLIGAWENISKSAALATVVLERIIDLFCVLTYFAMYIYFFSRANESSWFSIVRKSSLVALIVGMGGMLLLVVWGYRPKIINKVIGVVLFWGSGKFKGKVLDMANSFSNGLLILKHPKLMVKIIILSYIFWFIIAVNTAFMIWAFEPWVNFKEAIFVMGLLVLGIALPTPGGAGGFHWAVRLALIWVGVNDNTAAAIAIIHHFISVGPVLLIGLFFVWKEGLSWSKLRSINTTASA